MSQAWRKERLLPSWGLGLGAEAPSPRQSSRTGSATSRMYPLRFLSAELLWVAGITPPRLPGKGLQGAQRVPLTTLATLRGGRAACPGVLRSQPGHESPAGAPLPACPLERPRPLLSRGRGLPSRRNQAGTVLRSPVCFWGKTSLLRDSPVTSVSAHTFWSVHPEQRTAGHPGCGGRNI